MTLLLGYGRVSTSSGEQLSALDTQLAWLKDQGCDLVLSDVESGRVIERSNYQQARSLITAGRIRELRATALSRLGRDARESDDLIALCDEHNVRVLTRDDGILTLSTAEDLLLTRLKASLAQGESMRLSQRIKGGLEMGRKLGKPMRKPCWGYRLSRDRLSLEPDSEAFPSARRLIDHLIQHDWRMMPALKSFPEPLPLNSIRALRAWLLNPTIRGAIAYGQLPNHQFKEILWDRHPAILGHDEFASFQRRCVVNRKHWGANATRKVRALTGLCVCDECGWKLKYIAQRTIPSLKCGGENCSQLYRSTREELLIRYAIAELQQQAAERLASAVDQVEPPEAVELRRQLQALTGLHDPELRPVIEAKAARLDAILSAPRADELLVEKVADPRWWNLATYAEVTEALHALVAEIRVAKQAPVAIRLKL